jgi:hypothetical protein
VYDYLKRNRNDRTAIYNGAPDKFANRAERLIHKQMTCEVGLDLYFPEMNFGEMEGAENPSPTPLVHGRLSPIARMELYKQYLMGWSMKDICMQYGILPERAIAIVWMQ